MGDRGRRVRIGVARGVVLSAVAREPQEEPRRAPVLLVHGLASNARLWDGVADELARRGHPSVAVDLRGHGRSAKPDDGYDFGTVVADLMAITEAMGLDRPVAAGQSWGGNVVMELAARHPERVRGVVAVDGGTIELSQAFPDWDACAAALAPPHLVGTPIGQIEAHIRGAHPDWPETGIAGTLANFEVRADGTVAPWLTRERHMCILRHLWEHRPSTLYASIPAPVLLMPAEGPHDRPDRAAHRRAAVDAAIDALARARVRWFRPADHDLHAQQPFECAAVIAGAIEDGFLGP
jgi:pimeloyl-ACP methyl ester carboxylesterase